MLVSCAWLREWVATDLDARALAQRLTLGGLEVESIAPAAPELDARVVVGEIIARAPHPRAPRLSVCEVGVGDGALAIVCGAANAALGVKAPVALVGA
ncbi:MAG: phenylalanine--tRNA ligase subunit beta, partial [bacterium]